MGRLMLAGALLALIADPSTAADRPGLVAVLEFRNKLKGAEREQVDAGYFTDLVRSAVRKTPPHFSVITRENVELLLRAQGRTLADCEGECEVDTGKRLGADYVITGELLKIGTSFKLKMNLYETANGQFLTGEQAAGKTADELDQNTSGAVTNLLAPLAKVDSISPAPQKITAPESPVAALASPRLALGARTAEPKNSEIESVTIPPGTFQFQGERPISLNAFRLGKTAVTVAAYKRCVDAGACTEPNSGDPCNWGTDRSDHPINCVDWKQATAFCRWIGGRLPTGEELEYVASGGDEGRTYPWGNEEPGARVCWNGQGSDLGKGKRRTTCPVGAHKEGDSKWGLHDLAGNVSEWTSSDSFPNYSSSYQPKTVRGGSWVAGDPDVLRARYRTQIDPSNRSGYIGFRCGL